MSKLKHIKTKGQRKLENEKILKNLPIWSVHCLKNDFVANRAMKGTRLALCLQPSG